MELEVTIHAGFRSFFKLCPGWRELLTYSAGYGVRLSAKEKAEIAVLTGQNRVEPGNGRLEFSAHFTLPPGGIAGWLGAETTLPGDQGFANQALDHDD